MNKALMQKAFSLLCKLPFVGGFLEELRYENTIQNTVNRNKQFDTEEKVISELKRVYLQKIGRELNLDSPRSYTEKMQWSKLYDNTPLKGKLTDKLAVREWVKSKIGEEYLIPMIGDGFDCASDIDFDMLPPKFVLKTNNGSATNIIVKDKSKLNRFLIKRRLNFWLSVPFSLLSWFEFHYDYIEPKIIIEQYMHDDETDDLRDYKFLCFNGVPHFVWVDMNRHTRHTRKIFNMEWELQEWNQYDYPENNADILPPKNFELMKEIAAKLSKGFTHVRVDLYEINGKVYFGEMTFTNASGLEPINPPEADNYLGDLWILPEKYNKR